MKSVVVEVSDSQTNEKPSVKGALEGGEVGLDGARKLTTNSAMV